MMKTSWSEKSTTINNGITATNPSNNRAGITRNQALLFVDFTLTNHDSMFR